MPKPVLAIRHVPHEGLGTLESIFADAGLEFRYVDQYGDSLKSFEPDDWAGMVVLGGPMNVDEIDKFPFLAADVLWIRAAIESELPLLGICLGSQLIAKALNAKVYPNQTKEIGWYPISLTAAAGDDPLLAGLDAEQTVFQWHGDTFDLPESAVHLASSPLCTNQMFRFRENTWAIQFHIEVTAEMIDAWLDEPENTCEVDSLEYIEPQAIRAATPERIGPLTDLGSRVLSRFARICAES